MRTIAPTLLLSLCISVPIAAQVQSTMSDTSSPQRAALVHFIATKKFVPEKLYTGIVRESDRLKFQSLVNDLGARLLTKADRPLPKEQLLAEFKATLPAFELADTEDRERALRYLEEIMAIFGVASSNGILNKWRYGFDPNQSEQARNQEALAAMSEAERQIATKLDLVTATTALPFLMETFGAPAFRSASMTTWMNERDPSAHAVSLSTLSGQTVVVWLVKGRFTYARKL